MMQVKPYPVAKWTGRDQLLYEDTTGEPFDALIKRMQVSALAVEQARKSGDLGAVDVSLPTRTVYGLVFIAAHHTDPEVTWEQVLDLSLEDVQTIFAVAGGEPLPPPEGVPTPAG